MEISPAIWRMPVRWVRAVGEQAVLAVRSMWAQTDGTQEKACRVEDDTHRGVPEGQSLLHGLRIRLWIGSTNS